MAKIRHNNLLDTINEIISHGKKKGVLHLYTEDASFSGRKLKIKGKDLYHFGTTSYLGLGQDERLKSAAIEAIAKFGTQFPLSKTYLSHTIYTELENNLERMYGTPVIVTKNSTLGHIAVIPSIVRDEDVIIIDHQVHASVQNACLLVKSRGVHIELIRHSNLDHLEDKLKSWQNKYEKIWYMVDGVYSMYGDVCPIPQLLQLMEKYPNLHLYVDDVHGMSWAGEHGTGWIMSLLKNLHPRIIITSTLSKSFGASGGTVICSNPEMFQLIKNFGGPLTFSAQLEPSSVAAAVASSKIHLSDEIYQMQNDLRKRIAYCNEQLRQTELPLVEENECPVFFIGTGTPKVGYNLSNRMIQEGFFVNLGIFPAVPVKNTGIRFTVSLNNEMEDIEQLVDALNYHYPKALEEEGKTHNSVRKAFNLPVIEESGTGIETGELTFEIYRSISEIDKKTWDQLFGSAGIFDHNGLQMLEKSFTGNDNPEDNWDFFYYLIRDKKKKIVLATFFTSALWKDDMLAQPKVSLKIEDERKEDPYVMTSRVLGMGTLVTEGNHLYLNRQHPAWQNAISILLDQLTRDQEKSEATMIALRDLDENDDSFKKFIFGQGFIKIDMPETLAIEQIPWQNEKEYLESLPSKKRKHLKDDVLPYKDKFRIEYVNKLSEEELDHAYRLYQNVKEHNFDLNTFAYPKKFFRNMQDNPNWEFIKLYIEEEKLPVGIAFTYMNNGNCYNGVYLGFDYSYQDSHKVYKQILYRAVLRGIGKKAKKIYLGLTGTIEKKKYGAKAKPKVAYLQTTDNFKLEKLNLIGVKNV